MVRWKSNFPEIVILVTFLRGVMRAMHETIGSAISMQKKKESKTKQQGPWASAGMVKGGGHLPPWKIKNMKKCVKIKEKTKQTVFFLFLCGK